LSEHAWIGSLELRSLSSTADCACLCSFDHVSLAVGRVYSNLRSFFFLNEYLYSVGCYYFLKFVPYVFYIECWLQSSHWMQFLHRHCILVIKRSLSGLINFTDIISIIFRKILIIIFVIQVIVNSIFIIIWRLVLLSIFLHWYFNSLWLNFFVLRPDIFIVFAFSKDNPGTSFHIVLNVQIYSTHNLIFLIKWIETFLGFTECFNWIFIQRSWLNLQWFLIFVQLDIWTLLGIYWRLSQIILNLEGFAGWSWEPSLYLLGKGFFHRELLALQVWQVISF
jgi:hypothetical protein